MTDNAKKTSELPTANTVSSSDRLVVLYQANTSSPSTRTISISNLSSALNISADRLTSANSTLRLFSNGALQFPDGSLQYTAGGIAHSELISSNTNLNPGTSYVVDTSAATVYLTLPAAPTGGDFIVLTDGSDWGVHNVTVLRNGSNIAGYSEDLSIDVGKITVWLAYEGQSVGWVVTSNLGPTGYAGSQGSQGTQGTLGYTGSQGTTGATGYVGSKGDQGSIGYTGSIGNSGTTGYTGSSGSSSGLFNQVLSPTPTLSSTGLTSWWLNQGSATVADTPVGVTVTMPTDTAQYGTMYGITRSAPATPWKVTLLSTMTVDMGGFYTAAGLGVVGADNRAFAITAPYRGYSGSFENIVLVGMNDNTSLWAQSLIAFNGYQKGPFYRPIWFQIENTGSAALFKFSYDGYNFITGAVEALGSYYLSSISSIGAFFIPWSDSALTTAYGTVQSWKVE